MNTTPATKADPFPTQEAEAARLANTELARAANLAMLAELRDSATDADIDAHIRGMVAATMGQLSADASGLTRNHAGQWQQWALGVADGVAQTYPAGV